MKPTSLLITFTVLLHLFVIDLTFLFVTSGDSNSLFAIGSYNILWLLIAIIVGFHNYTPRRGN